MLHGHDMHHANSFTCVFGLCIELLSNAGQRPVKTVTIYRHTAQTNNTPSFVCAGDKAVLDMVSLDCEMCSTAEGLELTRASLIDSKGQVMVFLCWTISGNPDGATALGHLDLTFDV